jgi:ketosteroid isomerase-like protein
MNMNTGTDVETLLRRCYGAFNARDLEGALALMHPDVTWPNGWEGGWVNGRDGVRDYWQRQWAAIDPSVEPRAFSTDAEGRISVSVHAIVRDLTGKVLSDQTVQHVYEMQDGLVRRMEIRSHSGAG